MNLKKIAELASVSVSTVSKAFSGSAEISEATREKIFNIARENGCFEYYDKKKFAKRVIAVIHPEFSSEYYCSFVSVFDKEIAKRNGMMISAAYNFEKGKALELYDYFSSYAKVDGIIMFSNPSGFKNNMNIPTVLISSAPRKDPNIDYLMIDSQKGIDEAIAHLKKNGHTRIGFAGEELTRSTLTRFKNAMRNASLSVDDSLNIISDKRFEEAGEDAAKYFLENGDLPSAIFAGYDRIALGMIKVFRENGIRIPEDISIIGTDNIPITSYLETSLSTLHSNIEDIGVKAVDILMKKIDNRYYREDNVISVATEFIPRESSGPVKKEDN